MQQVSVGSLIIQTPLSLAPMVGLSHSALRTLIMDLGGVGLLFTEMLSATRLPGDSEKDSPFLIKEQRENPLFYQIYLSRVDDIQPAVAKIEQFGGQGIDLNLGCPAPKLRRQGAGVYLSNNREKLGNVLATLRKTTTLPLSVKIRLGAKLDKQHFCDYCQFLEDSGVDLITVHTRLDKEKFCRKPRWRWAGYAKESVSIPVFANGGIFSVDDALTCLSESDADGLMIGRAAAVTPWIFSEIYNAISEQKIEIEQDKRKIYFDFFNRLERFPEKRRLGRLKQFTTLYAESFVFGHHLATSVQRSSSLEEAKLKAEKFFAKNLK